MCYFFIEAILGFILAEMVLLVEGLIEKEEELVCDWRWVLRDSFLGVIRSSGTIFYLFKYYRKGKLFTDI